MKKMLLALLICSAFGAQAQENINRSKFKQLGQELPTPNAYRNAAGAPGHKYWQQQADYKMEIILDDEKQHISGKETITYTNNSPDELTYLWVQLDQNVRAKDADSYKTQTNRLSDRMSFDQLSSLLPPTFDGGFKIAAVTDRSRAPLPHTINKTMMRVELPAPLKSGRSFTFNIDWSYHINNRMEIGGRSGYEYFEDEDNYLYTIAQFFPRMAVYSDFEGWQHKQFLGRGEFALPFGDYEVAITVPADHIVAATGTLQNPSAVLTDEQRSRLEKAKNADRPLLIVTQEEAEANEKDKTQETKTWIYKAENVRDFAFASSRKFIWDAMGVKIGGKTIMAMSYYPKEGNPLWGKYSTEAVAQTLETYSKYTIDYPYPTAISVNAKSIGMEYPMICFNFGRCEPDGTYSERIKYGMITVIIHEVGHNFFPMIINSDERQWTWMDEGLNTFVQYLTEQEFERNYPSRRGPAYKMVDYMKGDKSGQMPIMTNSESILQFGNNAYGKPATALNVLRETVMGRELFDYAFKEYCRRWAFKHPEPADFFRTMEDASGVDLDWFWRGWFYTTDHTDISIENVRFFEVSTQNPEVENPLAEQMREEQIQFIGDTRNAEDIPQTRTELRPELADFYTNLDRSKAQPWEVERYQQYVADLSEQEKAQLEAGWKLYEMSFRNIGGLVMPLILEFTFEDGSQEIVRIPAEIWKQDNEQVNKVFAFQKPVQAIRLDPFLETADTDLTNNHFPRKAIPTRFELFKSRSYNRENLMQKSQNAEDR